MNFIVQRTKGFKNYIEKQNQNATISKNVKPFYTFMLRLSTLFNTSLSYKVSHSLKFKETSRVLSTIQFDKIHSTVNIKLLINLRFMLFDDMLLFQPNHVVT